MRKIVLAGNGKYQPVLRQGATAGRAPQANRHAPANGGGSGGGTLPSRRGPDRSRHPVRVPIRCRPGIRLPIRRRLRHGPDMALGRRAGRPTSRGPVPGAPGGGPALRLLAATRCGMSPAAGARSAARIMIRFARVLSGLIRIDLAGFIIHRACRTLSACRPDPSHAGPSRGGGAGMRSGGATAHQRRPIDMQIAQYISGRK